ncbi:MAG: serine protease [Bacteroides sp.]|nr:serine protease [Bacteroides sp.]
MAADNSRLYVRILLIFIAAVLIVAAAALFVFPAAYENECKTRVNSELESKLTGETLNANICVIQNKSRIEGNVEHLTYSAGASGVIFDKQAGKYYALTAYHVVSEADENTKLLIQPYTALPYSRYDGQGIAEYYGKFPSARVEYFDESCDLAIISFYSSEELGVVTVAEENAEKDAEIAVISNPEGERFTHTFGSIISNDSVNFLADDGRTGNYIIRHNAYIAPGSSGSAVLSFESGKAEIVGINIGGATNFMGKFSYGAMIPCQQVRSVIYAWRAQK